MWLIVWPLSFYYSQVGVLVWIWVALLAPESYLYGFLSGAPINKLVAASTLFAIFIGNGVRRLYLDGILFTLTVFVFHMGLSYLFSIVDTDLAASIFGKMTKIVVFAVVLCLVMDSRVRLHSSLVALALALGTVAVWEGTLLILTAGGHQFEGRSALGDNNHVAVALLMLLPVLIYLRRWSASRLARICFATVAAFDVLAVVASNSRG